MMKDTESYFGFGGSVSADIGTKVESKIVSNLKNNENINEFIKIKKYLSRRS